MVRVAIVGAGGIARAHAKCLRENPNAKIVGVVDTDRNAAEELASQSRRPQQPPGHHQPRPLPACAGLRRAEGASAPQAGEPHVVRPLERSRGSRRADRETPLFSDDLDDCLGEVDAVYVLTPPSFHREYSVKAMETGRHVFCEKPISTTLDDAEAMVDAAKRNGVKLMTAFNHRFRRGFRRLKEIVDSGSLGEVVSYWCQRIGMGIPKGRNWRTDPELLCGMSVESLSHDIDIIRWIAGEVADVRACVFESRPDIPGFDDNASVVMTLAGRGTALIHASWSSHLGRNSRGVIGTKGAAYVEGPGLWTLGTLRWKTEDMADPTEEVLNDADFAYAEENAHFIDCVANDREPSVSGQDGLAALRVSLAILRSHREKAVVAP